MKFAMMIGPLALCVAGCGTTATAGASLAADAHDTLAIADTAAEVDATDAAAGTDAADVADLQAADVPDAAAAAETADVADAEDVAPPPCAPKNVCTAVDKSCIGLVNNDGKTQFGLRMAEIDFTSPATLSNGLFGAMFAGAIAPQNAPCALNGQGLFSWLLQFDTAAGTLKTGGAKPVADASAGYSFDDEVLSEGSASFHVQPVTLSAKPDASGGFTVTSGADLILPAFLDASGTNAIVLPLHQARIATGTLSSHNDCIGSYNAAGLDPVNACAPSSGHPQFLDAGQLDGFISLEDADTVVISGVGESLCVLLSGNATTYGDGASPVAHCLRAGGTILYRGGWCAATNAAATASCADAEHVAAAFAASSVAILN